MTTGAAGAALFVKCRYRQAEAEMMTLSELALSDGSAFEKYIQSKREGSGFAPWLREATSSPLVGAELALQLLERLPEAREGCPRSMEADLLVGAQMLEASVRGSAELVKTNLRLFPCKWEEGERRYQHICSRLEEREKYRGIFQITKSIAVIGISDSVDKPAYYVPAYLKEQGFQVSGVHPRGHSTLADNTVIRLTDLQSPPDMVVVFRRSDKVLDHLDEILRSSPKVVWLQLGIRNDDFAATLRERQITVVSDRCAKLEHQRMI